MPYRKADQKFIPHGNLQVDLLGVLTGLSWRLKHSWRFDDNVLFAGKWPHRIVAHNLHVSYSVFEPHIEVESFFGWHELEIDVSQRFQLVAFISSKRKQLVDIVVEKNKAISERLQDRKRQKAERRLNRAIAKIRT